MRQFENILYAKWSKFSILMEIIIYKNFSASNIKYLDHWRLRERNLKLQ